MNLKIITSVWLLVAVTVVTLDLCYAQETAESTSENFNATTERNVTVPGNTTEPASSSENVTDEASSSTGFDYEFFDNWTTVDVRTSTRQTEETSPTADDLYSNVDTRNNGSIPAGGESSSILDSSNITVAGVTAGVILGFFALCYLGTMMNLCICRFFMYECPTGRYAPKEEVT